MAARAAHTATPAPVEGRVSGSVAMGQGTLGGAPSVRPVHSGVSPGTRAIHSGGATSSTRGSMEHTPASAASSCGSAAVRMVVCLSRRRPAQWPANVTSMLRAQGTVSFVSDLAQLRQRLGLHTANRGTSDASDVGSTDPTCAAQGAKRRLLSGSTLDKASTLRETRSGRAAAGSKLHTSPTGGAQARAHGSGGDGGAGSIAEGRGAGGRAGAGAGTAHTASAHAHAPASGTDGSGTDGAASGAHGTQGGGATATRPALVVVDVATTSLRVAAAAVQLCARRPPRPTPAPEPSSESSGSMDERDDARTAVPAPAPVPVAETCAVAVAWAESLRDVGSALEAGFAHASVGVGVQRLRSVIERSARRLRRRSSSSTVSTGIGSGAASTRPAAPDVVSRDDLAVAVVLVGPTPGDTGSTPEAAVVSLLTHSEFGAPWRSCAGVQEWAAASNRLDTAFGGQQLVLAVAADEEQVARIAKQWSSVDSGLSASAPLLLVTATPNLASAEPATEFLYGAPGVVDVCSLPGDGCPAADQARVSAMIIHRMHTVLARWRLQARVAGIQQQLWDAVQRLGSTTPLSAATVSLVSLASHPDEGRGLLHQSSGSMPQLASSPQSRDSGTDVQSQLEVETGAMTSTEATRLVAEQARKLQLQALEITELQERVSQLSQSVQATTKQLTHQRLLASRLLWKHLRASRFKNVPPMDRHLTRKEGSSRIGAYKLGQYLGSGSFGTVRTAVQSKTGRKVAIKVIKKALVTDVMHLDALDTEIKCLLMLTHPNIVRLLDVLHTKEQLYIVQDYVPNGDLRAALRDHHPVPEKMIGRWFAQLLSAVDHCHARTVCHRDITPANILLDNENNVHLADFGLAHRATPGVMLKMYCGSKGYIAPEVVLGLYDGLVADMWSLGCVLVSMICGEQALDKLGLAWSGSHPPASDVPGYEKLAEAALRHEELKRGLRRAGSHRKALRDLLSKLLTVDPAHRIKSGAALKHPWVTGHLAALGVITRSRRDRGVTRKAVPRRRRNRVRQRRPDGARATRLATRKATFVERASDADHSAVGMVSSDEGMHSNGGSVYGSSTGFGVARSRSRLRSQLGGATSGGEAGDTGVSSVASYSSVNSPRFSGRFPRNISNTSLTSLELGNVSPRVMRSTGGGGAGLGGGQSPSGGHNSSHVLRLPGPSTGMSFRPTQSSPLPPKATAHVVGAAVSRGSADPAPVARFMRQSASQPQFSPPTMVLTAAAQSVAPAATHATGAKHPTPLPAGVVGAAAPGPPGPAAQPAFYPSPARRLPGARLRKVESDPRPGPLQHVGDGGWTRRPAPKPRGTALASAGAVATAATLGTAPAAATVAARQRLQSSKEPRKPRLATLAARPSSAVVSPTPSPTVPRDTVHR